ncbi:hypothetical protein E5D57_013022 [Metarhizium anisopliae]|nr:hypothetical protein E5D57_013022 [Metarhizium anisopliae]
MDASGPVHMGFKIARGNAALKGDNIFIFLTVTALRRGSSNAQRESGYNSSSKGLKNSHDSVLTVKEY